MATVMIQSPTFGDIYFDAVLKSTHEYQVTATDHPVQGGAQITDHSIVEPEKISMQIGMSDVMGGERHSEKMFSLLRDLIKAREPVTVVTRFCTYSDMLLISMSVPDELAMMFGMKAELIFRHIEIVTAQVVRVQARIVSSKSDVSTPLPNQTSGKYDDLLDFGDLGVTAGKATSIILDGLLGVFSGDSSFSQPLYDEPTVLNEPINKEEFKTNENGVQTYYGSPVYEAYGTYWYIGP